MNFLGSAVHLTITIYFACELAITSDFGYQVDYMVQKIFWRHSAMFNFGLGMSIILASQWLGGGFEY